MSDEEFRLPKVTVFDHTVDGYLQLNAFYNYVVKREQEIQGWGEKAKQWDKWLESDAILTEAVDISEKLEAVKNVIKEFHDNTGERGPIPTKGLGEAYEAFLRIEEILEAE